MNNIQLPTKADTFMVTVRNIEPLMKQTGRKRSGLLDSLFFNIAAGLMVEAALILFIMMAGAAELIPFTVPALVVFLAFSLTEKRLPPRTRATLIAVAGVALIAAAIVFRKYALNGAGLIMNNLYDYGEAEQAYIYKRFSIGETGGSAPEMCMRVAVALASAATGLIASIPPARHRIASGTTVFILITLCAAYYGLLPSHISILLMVVSAVLLFGRGRIVSALPLLVAAGLIFAAIIAVDPGENYFVSRIDENLRDRFALGSVLLQDNNSDPGNNDFEFDKEDQEEPEENKGFFDSQIFISHRYIWIGLMIIIPIAVMAVIAYLIHRNLERIRAENRRGIYSVDPETAITAMFPYAMKWLRSCGVGSEEAPGYPFSEWLPQIREEISQTYAENFEDMNSMWKKAAYSDYGMTEEDRIKMRDFMEETIQMTKDNIGIKEKLKIRFRYAL